MHLTAPPPSVEQRYLTALHDYAVAPSEGRLLAAYELGRVALAEGLGVLEVAAIHSRAVAAQLTAVHSEEERARLLQAQTEFFVEMLSPFEMAHRAFRDANTLLRRLNDLLEDQAKRIAYALHSEAGQLLASVHLSLGEAARDIPAENARHVEIVRSTLGEVESRLRNISNQLRPPVLESLGLCAALELLGETISKRWSLPVIVSASLKGDIPAPIENTVYSITQEALTNAARHSGANRVEVDLRQTGHKIVCSIRDDGVGFDGTGSFRKRRPGFGLTEIRERVGALGGAVHLGRNDDRGTDLTFEIPLES